MANPTGPQTTYCQPIGQSVHLINRTGFDSSFMEKAMISIPIRILAAGAVVVTSTALVVPAVSTVQAQDDVFRLSGQTVAVYNLAGQVTVTAGSGSDVTVTVRRQGSDADQLDIRAGSVDTHRRNWGTVEALRVIYPSDDIRYDGMDGQTQIRVREDGTFWGGGRRDRGSRRVEISNRGNGLEASADLEVSVPAGKRVLVALAAGLIEATNVNGDLYLDTGSGNIRTTGTSGALDLDSGSGNVTVDGAEGDVNIDTGSGNVNVSSVTGPDLNVDSGSGSVTIDGVDTPGISIDTGSGNVTILRAQTGRVSVDTGSGDVRVVTVSGNASFNVDTGSGNVTIAVPSGYDGSVRFETGSGILNTDFPLTLIRKDDDEIQGRIGAGGSASIEVETGSGNIRLERS